MMKYPPREPLFFTSKEITEPIVCCNDCPNLRPTGFGDRTYYDYCSHMEGRIMDPARSWCNTGIVCQWMQVAPVNDVLTVLEKTG